MLNVKYLLFEEDNQQRVVKNNTALGNAWTIDSLRWFLRPMNYSPK